MSPNSSERGSWLSKWARSLESDDRSDPTLDLAVTLRTNPPTVPRLDPQLKASLRARLISRRSHSMPTRTYALLGWAVRLIVGAMLAAGLVAGSDLLLQEKEPVSAAQALEGANDDLLARTAGAAVVYDTWRLHLETSSVNVDGTAELWQATNNNSLRYQLRDSEGNFLFFLQRYGDITWQSIRESELVVAPVRELRVYSGPSAQLGSPAEKKPTSWSLIYGDVIHWVELSQWTTISSRSCIDLYCLLGLEALEDLSCAELVCELSLVDGLGLEISLSEFKGVEDESDLLTLDFTSQPDGTLSRRLIIERDPPRLVKLVAYDHGTEAAWMLHLGRQALGAADLPAGFFQNPPQELHTVEAEDSPQPPSASLLRGPMFDAQETVEIISVAPPPGTALARGAHLEVKLSYNLSSEPNADLIVGLGTDLLGALCVDLPCSSVRIDRGSGVVTVQISVEAENSWPEEVFLVVRMRGPDDFSFLNTLSWSFESYAWPIEDEG